MATVILNGSAFAFTEIEDQLDKIGVEHVSLNGTRSFLHRAAKGAWTISWAAIDTSTKNQVRALFLLTSTFTFVNEDGTNYTVYVPPGGYKATRILRGDLAPYWSVTLQIKQV